MNIVRTSQEIDRDRRRFLSAAAMTIVSTSFGLIDSADAQSSHARSATIPHTSFATLKQIDAGLLNIAYAETGTRLVEIMYDIP